MGFCLCAARTIISAAKRQCKGNPPVQEKACLAFLGAIKMDKICSVCGEDTWAVATGNPDTPQSVLDYVHNRIWKIYEPKVRKSKKESIKKGKATTTTAATATSSKQVAGATAVPMATDSVLGCQLLQNLSQAYPIPITLPNNNAISPVKRESVKVL